MRCVIISNGDIKDYEYARNLISEEDFVIAADGGLRHCDAMGVVPDVWIGDNDSGNFSCEKLDDMTWSTDVIILNPVKDATDTESACDYAIDKSFDEVVLLGSMGSRFDHTLANVYLLRKFADKGIKARIVNENNIIFLAQHHNIITKSDYKYVSLLPVEGDVISVTNRGFYYPLNGESLKMYSSRGVSNYLIEDSGEITLDSGSALIVMSRD